MWTGGSFVETARDGEVVEQQLLRNFKSASPSLAFGQWNHPTSQPISKFFIAEVLPGTTYVLLKSKFEKSP